MTFAILGGGQLDTGYTIDNSLRFNDGDNPYLDRTPSSAGNRKTWTWSAWIKRGNLIGSYDSIWSAGSGGSGTTARFLIAFDSSDRLVLNLTGTGPEIETQALFRDVSAWYHIVIALDTTQATASNRIKFYVNGVQQSLSFGFNLTQNGEYKVNDTVVHSMGRNTDGVQDIFDGYMSEVNFIDGQSLDPTSFGEFDANSGIWKPIEYTGTYGTNGFYLDFENSGSLGADQSGNSNNWTTNNLSGTYDQSTDTPTNNFCLINVLDKIGAPATGQANTNVGLTPNDLITGTHYVSTGKWYYEAELNSGSEAFIGWLRPDVSTYTGNTYQQAGSLLYYSNNGGRYKDGDGGAPYGASYTSGDIIGCALNLDDNQVTWYKNNSSQGTISITAGNYVPCFVSGGASPVFQANFGGVQSFTVSSGNSDENGYGNFEYAPPSGYLALCTQNMATELTIPIDNSQEYFNTVLWTGNGGTQSITGVGFQTDFSWFKSRSLARTHLLINSNVGFTKVLQSNITNSEETTTKGITSVNSDGFTIEHDGTIPLNSFNENSASIVSWNWKCNAGTNVSNTDGSITSTVQANTTAGFSVVSYTGNGSSSATIGHSLGVSPSMIIIKSRDGTFGWIVWHQNLTTNYNLRLDNTDTQYNPSSKVHGGIGTPSSTVLNWVNGTSGVNNVNASGDNYVAYCFAEIEGYSKFGKYTGNGSTDGPFIYTGFRPAFIMFKRTDTAAHWYLLDSTRNKYNPTTTVLYPSLSNPDGNYLATQGLDFLSNGFKYHTISSDDNASGGTYIYMAFAENPFVSSTGIPVTAR